MSSFGRALFIDAAPLLVNTAVSFCVFLAALYPFMKRHTHLPQMFLGAAFGWAVRRTNGHDIPKLVQALGELPFAEGKPNVLIADTVKGRGISFIEGRVEWHHKVPSREQYELALRELEVLS
mgnify:CR=1 FL=1